MCLHVNFLLSDSMGYVGIVLIVCIPNTVGTIASALQNKNSANRTVEEEVHTVHKTVLRSSVRKCF